MDVFLLLSGFRSDSLLCEGYDLLKACCCWLAAREIVGGMWGVGIVFECT